MFWETLQSYVSGLGTKYGVNPIVFAVIYIGAIPLFWLSVGWLVNSFRKKRRIALPLLSACFFFVSAYLYVIIAGRNVPIWVYVFIVIVVAIGGYFAVKKVQAQL